MRDIRVMISDSTGRPSILVDADANSVETGNFEFWVVNGAWKGVYKDGCVYVEDTEHSFPAQILSTDQKRLDGNYSDVFDNFDNPNWVSPEYSDIPVSYNDFDDDIPF